MQPSGEKMKTNDLAAALLTKAASVTDRLKRLKFKKISDHLPCQGVSLNKEKKKTAHNIHSTIIIRQQLAQALFAKIL